MPIIGTLASASARGYGGLKTFGRPPQNFEVISSFTATGSQNSVTLNNIPQTYSALELRISVRSTRAGNVTDGGGLRFNGTAGSIYMYNIQDANEGNSSIVNGADQSNSYLMYYYPAANATANVFLTSSTGILNYTATNRHPAASSRGFSEQGVNKFGFHGTYFASSVPITSMTIFSLTDSNFATGSTFTLYGLKGVA